MKKKKILKKLAAAALALSLGVSSMISVSAMSPDSLYKTINSYESKNQILSMENELRKNGFGDSNINDVKTALGQNDQEVNYVKALILSKLSVSKNKVDQIKSHVENIVKDLTFACKNFFNNASKYLFNPMINWAVNQVNQKRQACLASAKAILKEDHSLQSVETWKTVCEKRYKEAQKIIKETSEYISSLDMQNNINNFGFGAMQFGFNNFVPIGHNNMPNNNFNFRNFNNMPNNNVNRFDGAQNQIINDAAPAPVVQNNLNNIEAKKELENRFKKLSAGNQQIAGPCWLYATTTAINEFRERTNSGPIIKRQHGNHNDYSEVEIEYEKKGFQNPLSINDVGPNGKGTQDILDYARRQGLEARNVNLYTDDSLGLSKNKLVKFTTNLLREHFKYHKSPVLVEAPWGGGEFHELTIAGIVENELLVVNSLGDTVTWQPVEKLSDYCKHNPLFSFLSFIFFGNKENKNSEHENLHFAAFSSQYGLEKAKANLLKFARGDFNMKSLL